MSRYHDVLPPPRSYGIAAIHLALAVDNILVIDRLVLGAPTGTSFIRITKTGFGIAAITFALAAADVLNVGIRRNIAAQLGPDRLTAAHTGGGEGHLDGAGAPTA